MKFVPRLIAVCLCCSAMVLNLYSQVNPKLIQKPVQKLPSQIRLPDLKLVPIQVERILLVRTANSTSTDPGYYLYGGQIARFQVELSAKATRDQTVNLSYSNVPASYQLIGPSTVVVPAGTQFVDFDVSAPSFLPPSEVPAGATSLSMSVSAWTIDTTQKKFAQVGMRPGANTCTNPTPSLSAPMLVHPNSTITITVGLSCKSTTSTSVQITSSNTGAIPPPPGNVVVIPAGAMTGSYTTTTGNLLATTIVTISGFIPNTSPLVKAIDIQTVIQKP